MLKPIRKKGRFGYLGLDLVRNLIKLAPRLITNFLRYLGLILSKTHQEC